MRRGLDQPTSSSTSRATNTGTRDPTQQALTRTGQTRYEAPNATQCIRKQNQQQTLVTGRRSSQQPLLLLPQLLGEPQPPSPGRKSPSYLQGKNPYGRVLDKVEHPFRKPKDAAATGGPPSQVGATVNGRPRTSGSFEFKTRAISEEPSRKMFASDIEQRLLQPRQPPKPVSVKATRSFFESRAFQDRSDPRLPPSGVADVTISVPARKSPRIQQLSLPSDSEPISPIRQHRLR
jgi:hypothetical protein